MIFLKNSSLSKKLTLVISILVFVLFSAFNGFILTNHYQTSIENAEKEAAQIADLYALDIQKDFVKTNELLSALTSNMLSLYNNGVLTDDLVIDMVSETLNDNPNILGMAALFEEKTVTLTESVPDELVDTQNRFIPYLSNEESGISVSPLVDYDVEGAGDWYLTPKQEKRPILTEPYVYPINGQDILMTTISKPVLTKDGDFLGVITADFGIDYLNDLLKDVQPMGGYAALISSKGTYVAHGANPKLSQQPAGETGEWKRILAQTSAGKEWSLYTSPTDSEGETLKVFKPVHVEQTNEYWSFMAAIPKEHILASFTSLLKWSAMTSVVMVVIIVVILIIVIRKSLRPLHEVIGSMKHIAKGDLTTVIDARYETNDEIGQVAQQFNLMLKGMRSILQTVDTASNSLANSASDLSSASEEMLVSSKEVAGAVNEIAIGSSEQAKDIEATNQKTFQLSAEIADMNSVTKEMTELSEKASHSNAVGISKIEILREKSNESNEVIEAVHAIVYELSAQVKEIDEVIHSIRAISDQTNLLALNASIEAARAGDSGKGFAVVAQEVQKLAEQSKAATQKIQMTISDINKETAKAVDSMGRTAEMTKEQNAAVQHTEEAFHVIASSVQELLKAIGAVSSQVESMDGLKEGLVDSIQSISAISQQTAASAEEVSASTEEQLTALERVSVSAEHLSDSADELQTLIKQFKLS
jgi:methyl-accepting chemotaxis protein